MYTREPRRKESLTVTQVCHCRDTAAGSAEEPRASRSRRARSALGQGSPSRSAPRLSPSSDSRARAPPDTSRLRGPSCGRCTAVLTEQLPPGVSRPAADGRHAAAAPAPRCGAKGAGLREPPDGPGAFSRSSDGAVRSPSLRFAELRRRPRAATPPYRRPRRAAAPTPSPLSPRRPGSVADAPSVTARPRPSRRARRGTPATAGRSARAVPPRAAPPPHPAGGRGSGGSVSRGPLPAPPRPAPARRGLRHKYGPERCSRGGAAVKGSVVVVVVVAAATRTGSLAWLRVRRPRSVPASYSRPRDPPCPPTAVLPRSAPNRPHGLTGPHGDDGGLPLLLHSCRRLLR